MFATVLHNLKSPENIGMIVRTHVAFGGQHLVLIGTQPWVIRKRAQSFSRKLEKLCNIVTLPDDAAFFAWCEHNTYSPVAIEISTPTQYVGETPFPAKPAIVLGNEAEGLPAEFLIKCHSVLTIPQFGPVACLNVAASASIALFEFNRARQSTRTIEEHHFRVEAAEMPEGFEDCLPPNHKLRQRKDTEPRPGNFA